MENALIPKQNQNELLALEEKELAELAILGEGEAWGAGADLEDNASLYKNDYLLPKIWVMQAMSEQLKVNKDLEQGDAINSLTGDLIAPQGEKLEFVVVRSFKRWQAFKLLASGKKEYFKEGSGVMTLENANWPYEFTHEGINCRRRQVNSFIVLLKKDIMANNPQPYVIDFTSSSRKGGRKLVTALKNLNAREINGQRLPSAAACFSMVTVSHDFPDGSCHIKDINFESYTNKATLTMAKKVYQETKDHAGEIEFDDRDVLETEKADAATANASDIV